jgi:hypothetical protein
MNLHKPHSAQTAALPPRPCISVTGGVSDRKAAKGRIMGINDEREIEANLQIGPTDQGMVRLFIFADGIEIPMDFLPEEAEEIAEELRSAAAGARTASGAGKKKR